jgi:hypothetical protein
MFQQHPSRRYGLAIVLSILAALVVAAVAQQAPAQFGGAYSGLGARRQLLVDDWVARFNQVTGLKVEAGPFYDAYIRFSMKTTFDAVTHALMTTPLTDASGQKLGDALEIVERVDSVRGQVAGAGGDRQFRIYVTLKPGARDLLERSEQFRRGPDNTVYHKGFPISYRVQGGPPSIQVSVAANGRRADIDVDYRSSAFPTMLFNGHLTASNSDVRAGNNYDRHAARWTGLQNWWRSFLGIRLEKAPDDAATNATLSLPDKPRAGSQPVEAMISDFLKAWLVEGDIVASMGYISERAYACIEANEGPDTFDRGMAPYLLMSRMKLAKEALGNRSSLDDATVGVRLTTPGLKTVTQPHHAQFVVYSVPDDVATQFDCASRLAPGRVKKAERIYGNYFGAAFYVAGAKRPSVELLWAKDKGYWKVVSWQVEVDDASEKPMPADAVPDVKIVKVKADPTLVQAAKGFLESWFIRKDYDMAFRYVSPEAYGCYSESKAADAPVAGSPADGGRLIRAGLERSGNAAGKATRLDQLVAAAEPVHPAIRLAEHAYSRTFTLVSYPNDFGEMAGCATQVNRVSLEENAVRQYGTVFGMNIRFLTEAGEGPIMRTLWTRDASGWRITAYRVEYP